MTRLSIACAAFVSALQVPLQGCHGFLANPGLHKNPKSAAVLSSPEKYVEAVPVYSSVTDPEAVQLKDDLLQLAEETRKGFSSTTSQKKRAREIISKLVKFNPTPEPAAPYYENAGVSDTTVSLQGKWNLVYTDAPDITSLDTSWNPVATAELGRIGQECSPPYIKNVIEWKKPDWINQVPLPFAGNKESKILQKVCTKASASPDNPMIVNLEVVGLDLVAPPGATATGLQQDIEQEGLPVGLLRNNPLELRGPLTAPFGQFEILYLDEEMRIIQTSQNYMAVNLRVRDEWF